MSEQAIRSEKITKPIQLLGAWLAGLLSIDSCFLIAAYNLPVASFEAKALTIAAIVNVPLFLGAVFLLQTKFRPEMQEDSYYSSYLSRKTNQPVTLHKEDVQFAQVSQQISQLEKLISEPKSGTGLANHPISTLLIGVHKSLADRDLISEELAKLGVLGFRSFGNDELPEQRVVAISQFLSSELIAKVVEIARDLGFDYYTVYDNHLEGSAEDVLFGSYGEGQFKITKNTPSLASAQSSIQKAIVAIKANL